MPIANVEGHEIAYEVIGDGDQVWTLTPGGRFSKDFGAGIRTMAETLAARGRTVVIWDRPNCGASSVSFTGSSESAMQADALVGLLRHLGLAPAVIAGGSGGSRVSLLAATRHPDVAAGLALWWITGGLFGLASIALHYCGPSIAAAWQRGMAAVAELPQWKEVIERNPANRQRIIEHDREDFIAAMEHWMDAYLQRSDETVPGMLDDDARRISVPTLVFRSGRSDIHHPARTADAVASLIPGARLVAPPWGDTEWNDRMAKYAGDGTPLFENWPQLVPQMLEWAEELVPA